MAWLQLRTNAPGLPGAFIVEDRSVYNATCASKVLTFLTCPKSDAEDVVLTKLDGESFIINCPVFAAIRTRVKAGPVSPRCTRLFLDRITPTPTIVKQLYAQVFCPLSHLVALFVDDLGGLSKSAEVLASLLYYWKTLGMSSTPCLLVVTNDGNITEDEFIREVTLHYLELLRLSRTDTPPTYRRAKSTWTTNFHSITIVAASEEELHYHLIIYSEEVFRSRQQSRLAFSPETFHELIIQAVYDMGNEEQFNVVESLRSESQQLIPSLFVPYICKLLRTQDEFPDFNVQSLLASSLAVDSHRSSHHVFQAEFVFEEVYEPILDYLAREVRQPDLAASVKHCFCSFVAEASADPKALLSNHLNLLKKYNDLLSFSKACGICHFRVPTHTATCRHKLCQACVDLLGPKSNVIQYPICLLCQKGEVIMKPQSIAVRALILHGRTPRATVGFLHRLRRALLGPLEEYFDIIVASDKVACVVVDYFHHRRSLSQCLQSCTRRKWILNKLNRQVPNLLGCQCHLILLRGRSIVSSYDEPQRIEASWPEVIDAEFSKLWPSSPVIRVEHDSETSSFEENSQVNMAFAALFHVEVRQDAGSTSIQLTVFCSIPPGAHLQRVAMHVRSKGISLHYGDEGRWSQEDLCDISTWNRVRSGESFMKQIDFKHPNPALIQAKIDSLLETTGLLEIQVVFSLAQIDRIELKEHDLPFQHQSEDTGCSESWSSAPFYNTSEEDFQLRPLINKTEVEELSKTRDIPSVGSHTTVEKRTVGLFRRSEAAEIVETKQNRCLNLSDSTETVYEGSKLLCEAIDDMLNKLGGISASKDRPERN